MKRTMTGLAAVGTTVALVASAVGIAAADELRSSAGGPGAVLTVAPGGQVSVGITVNATDTPSGDPAGCDVSGGSGKGTITLSSDSYGSADKGGTNWLKLQGKGPAATGPATRDVANCRRSSNFTLSVGAGTAGNSYALRAAATGGAAGSVFTRLGDFTLRVVPGIAATSLALSPAAASVAYGTATQTWTATLTSAGSPVAGKAVSVSVGGVPYSATTDASGVASVTAAIGTTYAADPTAYTVDAAFAGDTAYASSSASGAFTVTQAAQAALSITSPTSGSFGDVAPVVTSGGSGTGSTTYAASGACSLTAPGSASVTVTSGTGTCTVTASNPGDTNYTATSATRSFTVGKAAQSPLSVTGPSSATFGAPDADITTSGGSGTGAVTVDAGASTGCSVVSGRLHVITAGGTCALTATKAGDADHDAVSTTAAFPVALVRATQTVTVTGPARGTYGQTYPITFTAGPGSGGVSFSSGTSTACAVADGQVRITAGTGTCDLTATQAEDADYGAATSAPFSVTPDKASATLSVTDLAAGYDGTAHAVTASVNPDVAGLSVTYDGSPTVPTHAGTYTVVASLSNADYVADQVTTTLVISPRTLTAAIAASGKEYDGTATAAVTLTSVTGVVPGDDVTVTVGDGSFDAVHAGARTATASLSLSGPSADDYRLASDTASGTATITPRVLTGSVVADSKTYDGSTAATAGPATPSLDRVVGDDAVNLVVGSAAFDSPHAGPRTVTAALTLGGADAGDYALKSDTATAPATISPLTLGAGITADDKVYDGSVVATVVPHLSGVLTGDAVAATPFNAAFDSKDVGRSKPVTSGLQLDNSDYALPAGPFSTTAAITPKALVGSFSATSRTYDGTSSAAVTAPALSGVVGEDDVTLTVTGAHFADKSVGTSRPVTAGPSSLGGADAGDYVLTGVTPSTADITPLGVTGSFTAASKTYDGSTAATPSALALSGTLSGDVVSLQLAGAAFADANVGTGKTVTGASPSLAGADAGNYALTRVAPTTADITPRDVTVTARSYTLVKGAPVPVVGYTSSGWVGSATFTTAPACSTAYTTASAVGSYPTTCSGGLASSNYALRYAAGAVTVGYAYSGLLQPVNADGSSRFKLGSTVPVKFQLLDANGVPQNDGSGTYTIKLTKLDSTPSGDVNETAVTSSGDTGTAFRWDATGPQYIYNLSTKALSEGTFKVVVLNAAGSTVTQGQFDIKR